MSKENEKAGGVQLMGAPPRNRAARRAASATFKKLRKKPFEVRTEESNKAALSTMRRR